VQAEVEELTSAVAELEEREQAVSKEELDLSYQLETLVAKVKEYQSKIKHWKKEMSRLELHVLEGLEACSLKQLSQEELAEVNTEKTQYQITLMEERNQKMTPNMAAIKEYKRKVCGLCLILNHSC
jgi:structural maintenance of chromosome 4